MWRGVCIDLQPVLFLPAKWMLVGVPRPVSVVVAIIIIIIIIIIVVVAVILDIRVVTSAITI